MYNDSVVVDLASHTKMSRNIPKLYPSTLTSLTSTLSLRQAQQLRLGIWQFHSYPSFVLLAARPWHFYVGSAFTLDLLESAGQLGDVLETNLQ